MTFSGFCLGTSRMLTLAVALAGITVFAPAPVNPRRFRGPPTWGAPQVRLEHREAGLTG
jgi:hypothetical protein